jgi:hypothetical protein
MAVGLPTSGRECNRAAGVWTGRSHPSHSTAGHGRCVMGLVGFPLSPVSRDGRSPPRC